MIAAIILHQKVLFPQVTGTSYKKWPFDAYLIDTKHVIYVCYMLTFNKCDMYT